jgi:hypothetical protein
MHPNLRKFIADFEREAAISGSYRKKLGGGEILFLEAVWGPGFNYDYTGLKAEHPFKDSRGGQRFADFVYVRRGMKLIVEIDGFTTHLRDISPAEFDDHLRRQNDLVLSGWTVLRFSTRQLERNPSACIRQLKQGIGHLWSVSMSKHAAGESIWLSRREEIIQLAMHRDGMLRVSDVAESFCIGPRTASGWLRRFAAEGMLVPASGSVRITAYKLHGSRL